ncbi:protease Do-like 5, chloroplastic [Mangifera indica]|uniref:protease Do-like 5, chloroplastic n=1 Tax=Mangifera indica TaxID=29780 RepID=UPI001CF94B58|nr:protease Do-like 5, chloroplastic [Mangifera indica]
MGMTVASLQTLPCLSPLITSDTITKNESLIFTRRALLFGTSFLAAPFSSSPSFLSAIALQPQPQDELEQQENRIVDLFQGASPSVVFIQDFELAKTPKNSSAQVMPVDETAKVEGTGSGFIWDKFGHIVTNYHVVAKLATDNTGLQRCKVLLVDAKGNRLIREGKIIGSDPAYDLAVLKVNVEGYELKPVVLGTSRDLRVGQSCFAIGNPYGFEDTLTTGVVSGLGREIPSPNGGAIRGVIQTDASINAGNSGGPLIDSYGHVIGVNTATFTRKGTGVSSGVNFAIPIDTVVRTVPYLIVYGTPYSDRF